MSLDLETGELTGEPNRTPADVVLALVEAQQDLTRVERDLRGARREIARLKTELTKQRTAGAEGYKAKAIFRYWVQRCGKPKTTKFGEKRQKVVAARLAEYDVSYIARAIDGLAVGAYVSPSGKRYDDLELVCRDEVKLESFYEIAERTGAPTNVGPMWLREFEGGHLDD